MHPQSGSRIILRGLVFFLTLAALAIIAGFVTYGNNALALAAPDTSIGVSAAQGTEGGNCQPWTLVNVPNPRTHHYLNDVDALAPNDIWAVGEYYDENNYTPDTALTMHWDGTQWTIVPTPEAPASARLTLYGVSALSPNDVWAVGENFPS
ncbi:MAG TPA: hypothetical protein VEW94_00385, partial [Chloroflexia bacterium]|nr:hypothetical protein [Chloroflexia bacterium]